MLTRAQILAADDLARETVEVPEWGGSVIVQVMRGIDRDAFESSIVTNGRPDLVNMRAKLAAVCMVDESGQRLFSVGDVESLGAKSASALERVARGAQRLNRLGDAQLEEMKGN
jgi:L-asparaginase II